MIFKDNLYWKTKIDANKTDLVNSCVSANAWTSENLTGVAITDLDEKFFIHDVYNAYNMFGFPLPEVASVYKQVCHNIKQVDQTPDLWIKAWVNVYGEDKFHDWHSHKTDLTKTKKSEHTGYHGIICVNGEDSCTSYRLPTTDKAVHIYWEDLGMALIPNLPEWQHRTWPYKNKGNRITIAFNVMHLPNIDPFLYSSNWLPVI